MTASRLKIIPARSEEDIAAIDELFREYAQSISVDLEYQGFSAELASLPGQYAPPSGDLLLAKINEGIAGCVALRALDESTLELKRLYVRPSARGAGVGKRLVQNAISIACEKGYKELRLDTLATMMAAQQLYRSLGFVEIPPYGRSAVARTRFYSLQLAHTMSDRNVPSLYEWIGGIDALNRLTTRFYMHVKVDAVLAPVFARMGADHPAHVAAFLAEVLGGPTKYSEQHGGHPHMIQQHLNRHLTHEQRRRWVGLLLETADEVGMPDDPEFRSALVGYLEWGSRLAVINSQPGVTAEENAPMPKWGWGEVKGPYVETSPQAKQ